MKIYCSIDGDRIGARIEVKLLQENLAEAKELSDRVNAAMREIVERIKATGGKLIFWGGDSIFAEFDEGFDENLREELSQLFSERTGCTISIGTGNTPLEAYLKLKRQKIEKGSSKNSNESKYF